MSLLRSCGRGLADLYAINYPYGKTKSSVVVCGVKALQQRQSIINLSDPEPKGGRELLLRELFLVPLHKTGERLGEGLIILD